LAAPRSHGCGRGSWPLPPGLRDQINHKDGDCSITRPRTRTTSSIIDAKTAALLERFRTPVTIVDAVIAYSAAAGADPRATLEEAFTVLAGLVNDGLLVPPRSELARPIQTTLVPGAPAGGFEIVAPVHVIVDTEVYLARSPGGEAVALKVAREGSQERMRRAFARETVILAGLDGRVAPRLLGQGDAAGRPFLATSWCPGCDVYEAAAEARRLGGREGRSAPLALAERVVWAYAQLHAQDVLHGDVHPRNVLAGGDGRVTIIDFGLAGRPQPPGTPAAGGRGGIDFFMEPEVARARLAGTRPPAVSAAGEQYSVAALVCLLLTVAHTHLFALEEQEMLRQLVEEPCLPFERHGVTDMCGVARVVGRALAGQPGERYASLADMYLAFRDAAADDLRTGSRVAPGRWGPGAARLLLDDVLARLSAPGGGLFADGPGAPTASVFNGAAGFAYALLRVAGIRGDEVLLGQADLWSVRALRESPKPDAFWNQELELVPETTGERSLLRPQGGVDGHDRDPCQAGGQLEDHPLGDVVGPHRDPVPGSEAAEQRPRRALGCRQQLGVAPAPPARRVHRPLHQRGGVRRCRRRVAQSLADGQVQDRLRAVRGPVRGRQRHDPP